LNDRDFVLRTTSVSPLDRDKDTLSLTRKTAIAVFRSHGFGKIRGEMEKSVVFSFFFLDIAIVGSIL